MQKEPSKEQLQKLKAHNVRTDNVGNTNDTN